MYTFITVKEKGSNASVILSNNGLCYENYKNVGIHFIVASEDGINTSCFWS